MRRKVTQSYLKHTDMDAKKEKYVIRYNIRTWIDITVEAESGDEAYELAEEKYCTGDYEEHPGNSETWSTENVTKEYND